MNFSLPSPSSFWALQPVISSSLHPTWNGSHWIWIAPLTPSPNPQPPPLGSPLTPEAIHIDIVVEKEEKEEATTRFLLSNFASFQYCRCYAGHYPYVIMRDKHDGSILGCIQGISRTAHVIGKDDPTPLVSVDGLCVHRKYRKAGIAAWLIHALVHKSSLFPLNTAYLFRKDGEPLPRDHITPLIESHYLLLRPHPTHDISKLAQTILEHICIQHVTTHEERHRALNFVNDWGRTTHKFWLNLDIPALVHAPHIAIYRAAITTPGTQEGELVVIVHEVECNKYYSIESIGGAFPSHLSLLALYKVLAGHAGTPSLFYMPVMGAWAAIERQEGIHSLFRVTRGQAVFYYLYNCALITSSHLPVLSDFCASMA
jgi:hypothetical protein